MKVRIDYDEIDELVKYITQEKEKIESIYSDIKDELKEVENIWKGKDSDAFVNISLEYIEDAIKSLDNLSIFKDNLNDIVKLYKICEENFNNQLKES